MTWINDLDACAAAGVLNFDAPSYIRGTNPRYVGNPELANITGQIPNIKPQPQKDEFNTDTPYHNPSWKKLAFGIFAGGIALLGLYKFRNAKVLKNLFDKIKNFPTKICNMFKPKP